MFKSIIILNVIPNREGINCIIVYINTIFCTTSLKNTNMTAIFRVYNCHFESYNISMSGILRSVRRQARDALKETEHKMRRGITRRPRQVNQVMENISKSPVPAFVCGDFNDSPMSYTYYRLSKGRDDSFRKAGEWFGSTFSFLWPLLRIDYVLLPHQFEALSHRTPHKPYSDHYPVVTEVSVEEQN